MQFYSKEANFKIPPPPTIHTPDQRHQPLFTLPMSEDAFGAGQGVVVGGDRGLLKATAGGPPGDIITSRVALNHQLVNPLYTLPVTMATGHHHRGRRGKKRPRVNGVPDAPPGWVGWVGWEGLGGGIYVFRGYLSPYPLGDSQPHQ